MPDPDMSSFSDAQMETLVVSAITDPVDRRAAKAVLTKRQRQHEIMMAEATIAPFPAGRDPKKGGA
jgi:hypothetical protein